MLGITDAKPGAPVAPNMLEQLRALQQAIASYALQLVAAAHADTELVASVRKALRPLDELRQARRAGGRARGVVVRTWTRPRPPSRRRPR